ncbi:MAG: hypothetical protein J5I59_04145 [Saprospiraceae bacterium]|nr:hypothetical protein [Saprospiraceae bacterium]
MAGKRFILFGNDSMITGIGMGIAFPIIMYAIILTMKDALISLGVLPEFWGDLPTSTRTLTIIALCGNLLLIHYFNNRRWYESMRGLVFPTLTYVGLWVWFFGLELMGRF